MAVAKSSNPVRMCPVCNSTDISVDFSNAGLIGRGTMNNMYVCNNCSHRNTFFPTVPKKNIPTIKSVKKVGKRDLVNTYAIKNMRWKFFKIYGPSLLVVATLGFLYGFIRQSILVAYLSTIPLIFGIFVTVTAYRQEWYAKYPIVKYLILLLLVMLLLLPAIPVFLGDEFLNTIVP